MDEKIYTLGFSAFSGIGTIRFEKLIVMFGDAEKAWKAEKSEIIGILGESVGQRFSEFRKEFSLKKYAKEVEQKEIQYFAPSDKKYPAILKRLARPPFILFAKGNVSLLQNDKTIAIVGTRKVTSYGVQVTEMLTRELVAHGFSIVSGLALGVDGIAHKEALKNNGNTIAVLGSGVDIPTPREHVRLYREILENNGLIVSTFSPGEDAHIGSFPARNAIVAGISQGVVVTEGAADSGALITAEYGKKFGRPIFSVPGQITSQLSQGTNNLIKNGAIPVTSSQEILDRLGIMGTPRKTKEEKRRKRVGETKEERIILDLLENGPLHFDEIVRTIGKDSKTIGSLLSLMELKGMIKSISDGKYSLSS